MYITRNKTTKEILARSRTPFAIDEDGNAVTPIGLDENLEILEVVQLERPEAEEGKKVVGVIEEANGQIIHSYKQVALSAEEITQKEEQEASQTEFEQIKELYQDLKNGVGTAGERMTRVERVLARLLKDRMI